MLEPHRLGNVLVVQLERRRERGIEDLDFVRQHLDLARPQVRVDGARGPRPHHAGDAQHVLGTNPVGALKRFRPVGIAHHLREALAITQVDENHAAVVAAAVRPAGEAHALADQRRAELPAVVRAHVHFPAALPRGLPFGGTTPIEMMYFSASSTLMSSSITSLRATITK
jgi:hypothetical protein